MDNLDRYWDTAYELMTTFGVRVLAAILIFFIGRWIAKQITKGVRKLMEKANTDAMLVKFVSNLVYVGLLVFVVLGAINQLGVQTASFIAVIGAAGLAVGLALQGSLANFAAGVLMLIFKPFKVGDFIEGGGTAGVVEGIQIFNTVMRTPDNKLVIVPNGQIYGGTITNYSAKDTRRVDLVLGVGYDDSLDKVRSVIDDVLSKDERILSDPAPTVGIVELGDSSVNFAVRPWAKSADYWPLLMDLNETFKKRFDAEGISIPFPQRDVHVYEHKA